MYMDTIEYIEYVREHRSRGGERQTEYQVWMSHETGTESGPQGVAGATHTEDRGKQATRHHTSGHHRGPQDPHRKHTDRTAIYIDIHTHIYRYSCVYIYIYLVGDEPIVALKLTLAVEAVRIDVYYIYTV